MSAQHEAAYALRDALAAREAAEEQATRESLARAAIEERRQRETAGQLERERRLHEAMTQRVARDKRVAAMLDSRAGMQAEAAGLLGERQSLAGVLPKTLSVAVALLLAAAVLSGGYFAARYAPQPAAEMKSAASEGAKAALPMMQLDRDISAIPQGMEERAPVAGESR